ncbi:hypothetical protein M413DRAFT_249781 [Hebeloma cylindrosporum]|uniref:Uncharacterized protein n=1 Tax=Hebeloma cylindrosporum TaxID=76867 RepID=A0A0C2XJR4_HEBCY|nr:hypothetical protein M413DRAFT_249781 [Hebeloma cylindrosporum h7]
MDELYARPSLESDMISICHWHRCAHKALDKPLAAYLHTYLQVLAAANIIGNCPPSSPPLHAARKKLKSFHLDTGHAKATPTPFPAGFFFMDRLSRISS